MTTSDIAYRRTPPKTLEAIRQMAMLGKSAPEIERDLSDTALASSLPSIRQLRRIVRQATSTKREPWPIGTCAPEDAPAIMAALRELVLASRGKRLSLDIAEAEWVARINRVASDLPPLTILFLASRYAFFAADGEPAPDVDLFLAMAPWRCEESQVQYSVLAVQLGLAPPLWPHNSNDVFPQLWADYLGGRDALADGAGRFEDWAKRVETRPQRKRERAGRQAPQQENSNE